MSPKLQRQRPEPQSHLVRKPEPIRTGAESADAAPDSPAPDSPAPAAERAPEPATRARPSPPDRTAPKAQRRAPRSQPGAPARPSARDLAAPARPSIAREALKADVPADLALLHRLHRYRLDTGTDIRDQVAIAVDEWLTSQGY
jgi:hypothetical protein